MLPFGRVPALPPQQVAAALRPHLVQRAEETERPADEAGRQTRSRYYKRLAVLPTAAPVGPLPRRSSHPLTAPVRIPAASASVTASNAASRFSRAAVPSSASSQSLPSALRRSRPIDIPTGRRSFTAARNRNASHAAADDTDGSTGSGDSDSVNEWLVAERRLLSESFVDDSRLEWSGRCLDGSTVDGSTLGSRKQLARWSDGVAGHSGCGDGLDVEGEAEAAWPFPLLVPSYHVD